MLGCKCGREAGHRVVHCMFVCLFYMLLFQIPVFNGVTDEENIVLLVTWIIE